MKVVFAKCKAYTLIFRTILGEGEDDQDQCFRVERLDTPPQSYIGGKQTHTA